MKFAPVPGNDFARYIRCYYDECRKRFPGIEAIAGKWEFRDLIPGMSDFDTRFILREGVTAADWCRMSAAIGETHLALCREYPHWARNLEHLPGINLTWAELTSEKKYYPEYEQWTFYHTEQPQRLASAQNHLRNRPWDVKNEYFHLKKFCLYYGRYDRRIDPPVNLGIHESKYPLHSRLMHYFNPPVMSAVCLLDKVNLPGKFAAFERARTLFPKLACWPMLDEIFGADYRLERWYAEPALSQLEDAMEEALRVMAAGLREAVSLAPCSGGVDVGAWKQALQNLEIEPALKVFEHAKFARLMKGRLRFYASAPEHFDTGWLLRNEFGRMGNNLFYVPFRIYWELKSGRAVDDPSAILDELRGDPLTDGQVAAARAFVKILAKWRERDERATALALAEVFDDYFGGLNAISEDLDRGGKAIGEIHHKRTQGTQRK